MRASVTVFAIAAMSLALAACQPPAPKGIDAQTLHDAISDAIGDPNTCVLIVEKGGGKVVFRYGEPTTCAIARPACDDAGGMMATEELGEKAAAGDVRTTSCDALGEAGDRVGWASGPITPSPGAQYGDLAYAANMQGPSVLPGREIKVRLESAFRKAGM